METIQTKENIMIENKAKLTEIKDFFGFKTITEFKVEWEKLNDAEKDYFKTAVFAEIHSN